MTFRLIEQNKFTFEVSAKSSLSSLDSVLTSSAFVDNVGCVANVETDVTVSFGCFLSGVGSVAISLVKNFKNNFFTYMHGPLNT